MEYSRHLCEINDTLSLFIYYFNHDSYLDKIAAEDQEDFISKSSIALNDSRISDDVMLFFYKNGDSSDFVSKFIYDASYDFTSDTVFDTILRRLSAEDLFGELLFFYTGDAMAKSGSVMSSDYLYRLLSNASIPEKIKLQLMHYNYNRKFCKDTLVTELTEKYALIRRYYSNNSTAIESVGAQLADDRVQDDIHDMFLADRNADYTAYYSVSLLQRSLLFANITSTSAVIGLGYDSVSHMNSSEHPRGCRDVNPLQIAKAFADDLRYNIYCLIKERSTMSTTEVANFFEKGLAAACYHLNILTEANLLTYTTVGRKVLYSVDYDTLSGLNAYIAKQKKDR